MGNAVLVLQRWIWCERSLWMQSVCFLSHIKCCVLFNQTAIVIIAAQTSPASHAMLQLHIWICKQHNETDNRRVTNEMSRGRAGEWLKSVSFLKKNANRRGEKDGQSRGQSRETAGGRGETDYSHTLITMSSPTLTGPRLGHNTNTWDLPMAEWRAGLANGRSAEIC